MCVFIIYIHATPFFKILIYIFIFQELLKFLLNTTESVSSVLYLDSLLEKYIDW